jgi:hypothetical protein
MAAVASAFATLLILNVFVSEFHPLQTGPFFCKDNPIVI